jgi:hypothetical protein
MDMRLELQTPTGIQRYPLGRWLGGLLGTGLLGLEPQLLERPASQTVTTPTDHFRHILDRVF